MRVINSYQKRLIDEDIYGVAVGDYRIDYNLIEEANKSSFCYGISIVNSASGIPIIDTTKKVKMSEYEAKSFLEFVYNTAETVNKLQAILDELLTI